MNVFINLEILVSNAMPEMSSLARIYRGVKFSHMFELLSGQYSPSIIILRGELETSSDRLSYASVLEMLFPSKVSHRL